jgi:hypothetical protein
MLTSFLKRQRLLLYGYALFRLFTSQFRWSHFKNIFWYANDYWNIKKKKNNNFSNFKLAPYLNDKTIFTPIDPVYFFQDTWAARKIFELKPSHHYDVGSSAKTIGILSQFVPITMIDIRPLPLVLPNLCFIKGSILDLPFEDNSFNDFKSLLNILVSEVAMKQFICSEESVRELKRAVMAEYMIFRPRSS